MSVIAADSDVFRAVADYTRRAILDLLRESECTVGELARPFRMTRPAVSQHLRILREVGLVRARRSGREHVYRLNPAPLRSVNSWIARYGQFTDPVGHVWRLAPMNEHPRSGARPAGATSGRVSQRRGNAARSPPSPPRGSAPARLSGRSDSRERRLPRIGPAPNRQRIRRALRSH